MIQLRVRTEYSFGQTFAPIPRVVQRLKEIGSTHAGIVDKDGTWGHVQWHEQCRAAGIVPILGVELVVSEQEDVVQTMWFLARNAAGLRELYNFTSLTFKQRVKTKFGGKPRLYYSDVLSMSENIYVFAGDILDVAFLKKANAIMDLSPASRIANNRKKVIAAEQGLRVVSVSDNAFAYPEDRQTYELMDGGTKPTPQFILDKLEHHLDLEFESYDLPQAPMLRREGDLAALCAAGRSFRETHHGLKWDERYDERLKRELDLIKLKDFESYFIIVADLVVYAKMHMLVGPSRGSSAGSLVCYLTRITEIDPIPANLFFERFIDESRKDLPDIDIDFPGLKRDMIFKYMAEQYTHVANIGTIQQFQPKSALIHVCKKLGIPGVATAGIKAAMIERSSGDARANDCLQDTFDTTKAGQELVKMYPDVVRSSKLEGHASHTGKHAAGLMVCNEPLENYCTITDLGTAQVDKSSAEKLNLLKIDVLGLRTLDILEDSGVDVDWYALPLDDPKTYDVFNRQAMSAIFQFSGQSMRNLSSQIDFKTIDDIDVVTALARPGPFGGGVTAEWMARKNGKPYDPIHPIVEKVMANTFGLPVYQEQTLAIVRNIGKFDWVASADVRKAISKSKGKEYFNSYWPRFLAGATEQGMSEEQAAATWHLIDAMGAWQMNKAHTYSYAVIGYWTAWLKAHHPYQFAAANMRHANDEEDALTMLQEMVREGLMYEPFNLEKSGVTWEVRDGVLQAGFDSLKGFGRTKAQKFVEARDNGELTDSQYDQIDKATSIFNDLFPMHRQFREYYDNPGKFGILDNLVNIADITEESDPGSYVFIGRLIDKNLRDANEDVNVKKRGGKLVQGPVMFLDFRLADDTGRIQCRIDRKDYQAIGKQVFESPHGAVILVRARFIKASNGDFIRFGFVQKVKILEAGDVEAEEQVTKVPRKAQKKFSFAD